MNRFMHGLDRIIEWIGGVVKRQVNRVGFFALKCLASPNNSTMKSSHSTLYSRTGLLFICLLADFLCNQCELFQVGLTVFQ